MPKISVLIPVYNVEKYIEQCLNSVINQTIKDIEIICVLDGCKDASADICKMYADHDKRIRIIDHVENRGLLVARKTGVESAKGEYIMFLDSDDWLELDACSRLYDCIKTNDVDILQFGSYVDAESSVPEERILGVEKLLSPYVGKLMGKKVFEGAFKEEKFRFSIWNKIYRAELCKEVYKDFNANEYIFKAEDLCAFFRLAYMSKSYVGIKDKFYHYRFGAGITGKNNISLSMFETICRQSEVSEKCRQFLVEQGAFEKYEDIFQGINWSLLNECINNWHKYLNVKDSVDGFKCLTKYWNGADLAIALTQRWYYDDGVIMLSDKIYSPTLMLHESRKIQKIAIYYHRYSMGGVQKVLSLIMAVLRDQGYEILFITDEEPSETDYELPDSVKRVVIPSSNKPEEYPSHAIGLRDALVAFNADLVIYNATSSHNMLFDSLIIKSMGIYIMLYVHEYYGVGFSHHYTLPIRKIKTFRFADKVVALSQVQRDYWRATGSNAVYMYNPLEKKARNVKLSSLSNHDIAWVGRLSKEKRYTDALDILARVVKVIPDARILFIGSFSSQKDESEFFRKVDSLGIRNNIKLYGYVNDVYPIYERSSLYLLTSEAESFSMSLAESKVAGLPCVMYKMPYLEMQRDSRGIIIVDMMDTAAAAESIIEIFSDSDLRHRLGAEARESIETVLSGDYGKDWRQLIEEMEIQNVQLDVDENQYSRKIVLNTLIDAYIMGRSSFLRLEKELKDILSYRIDESGKKKLLNAEKEITLIRMSASYKVGRFITWVPRKLRGFARCIKDNGFKYTWYRCIEHITIIGDSNPKQNKIKLPLFAKVKLKGKLIVNNTEPIKASRENNQVSISVNQLDTVKTTISYAKSVATLPKKDDLSIINNRRILIVTHQLEYTGSEHSLLRMCQVLQSQDVSVDVWSYSDGGFRKKLDNIGIGVEIVDPRSFLSLEMQERIKEYDLTISNTALTYSFIVASQNLVRTIWYIREAQNLPLMLPGNKGLLKCLLNAKNIYCVSEYAQDFIVANYNKQVRVLHNCVEDEFQKLNISKNINKGNTIKFLTLGTIEKRKGYDVLLHAYLGLEKSYRDKSEIHFAGRLMPFEWAKRFHEPFLSEIENKEGIYYHGEITDRNVILRLIDEADVIVIPSRDESCSLVALEGAMMGKPLIVTENVGAKYLVNDLNGWIVKTGDKESLRKVFKEIIDNPKRLKGMGVASRVGYLKTSTYEIFGKNFIEMIKENLQ